MVVDMSEYVFMVIYVKTWSPKSKNVLNIPHIYRCEVLSIKLKLVNST